MMGSPAVDVKDLIDADSGAGLTFATDLFVSEMPASPDRCVCVYDTGGDRSEVDYEYERPSVQVIVRGAKGDYADARDLAQSIKEALNGRHNETVNSSRYVGIWLAGDVNFVGYDDNHRPLLTLNFRTHRTGA